MPEKIIDAKVVRENYEQRYGLFHTRSQEVSPVGVFVLINNAYFQYLHSIVLRLRTYNSGLRLN